MKTLVEMHGGTVTAFSEGSGLGSEFIVRLPLVGGTITEHVLDQQAHAGDPQVTI